MTVWRQGCCLPPNPGRYGMDAGSWRQSGPVLPQGCGMDRPKSASSRGGWVVKPPVGTLGILVGTRRRRHAWIACCRWVGLTVTRPRWATYIKREGSRLAFCDVGPFPGWGPSICKSRGCMDARLYAMPGNAAPSKSRHREHAIGIWPVE
jgi:hypothetical protein